MLNEDDPLIQRALALHTRPCKVKHRSENALFECVERMHGDPWVLWGDPIPYLIIHHYYHIEQRISDHRFILRVGEPFITPIVHLRQTPKQLFQQHAGWYGAHGSVGYAPTEGDWYILFWGRFGRLDKEPVMIFDPDALSR